MTALSPNLSPASGRDGRNEPLRNFPANDTPEQQARAINLTMEKLIAQCPAQYIWSYNRYKTPAHMSTATNEARSLSDLGSAAAKTPERSIFHRLFGQYRDIDAANPAKSVLVQLFFRYRRPKSDRLLEKKVRKQ
jgi:hypothetical protein